ncbi:MAG: TetR/AcrR family transcriptional regulator [Pseudomonadota bacterium]
MKQIHRSAPKQPRARTTIDYILDGTAQLLERVEGNSVTTAKVAERAGFSVGTVYRYFSDKHSLFRALAIRELERTEQRVDQALADHPDAKGEELILAVIQSVIKPFDARIETQRRVNMLIIQDEEYRQIIAQKVLLMYGRIAKKIRTRDPESFRSLSDDEVPILMGSIAGPTWVTLRMNPQRLHHPDFAKRLARIVHDFYRAEID